MVRLTLDAASHRILDRSCAVVQTDPNGQADPEITQYIRSVTDPFEPYFREPLGSLNERWRMTLGARVEARRFSGGLSALRWADGAVLHEHDQRLRRAASG